jgi:tetratricopeptide (TPR) repeat protein
LFQVLRFESSVRHNRSIIRFEGFRAMSDRPVPRSLKSRLLLAIVAPLLAFAVAEVGVRVAGLATPAGLVAVRPGEQSGTVSIHALGIQAETPRATPAFPARKKPGAYRIVFFGESAAAGFPYLPKSTPARWLQLRIQLLIPQRDVEVIDATISGINSDWIVAVAHEMLAFEPDLFVVYPGNNEFLDPYVERRANPSRVELREFIRRSAFVRLLYDWSKSSAIDAQFSPPLYPAGIDDTPLGATRERVLDTFAENMDTLAREARTAGVNVLFVRPAVALRGWSPRGSVFSRVLDAATKDQMRELVHDGTVAMRDDHYAEAADRFAHAASIDPNVALLVFRQAELAEKQGDATLAYALYRRALDLDDRPNRVGLGIASRLQAVAERDGAHWFDSHQAFEKFSKDGIVGSDLVIDHCHLSVEGQYRLSTELLLKLSQIDLPVPMNDWKFEHDLSYTACLDKLGIELVTALLPELQIGFAAVVAAMNEPNQEQRLEHLARARDRFDTVLRNIPNQARAMIGRGLVRAAKGDVDAALKDFDNAVAQEPGAVRELQDSLARFGVFQAILDGAGLIVVDGKVTRGPGR